MGRILSVASSMFGFSPYICFTDLMIGFTDLMIFLSLYIGKGHDTWHILTDGLNLLPLPSMNAVDQYICFTDFMIPFNDFMIFLSSYMG